MPKINTAGLNIIKSFEGLELNAYKDPGGLWTIGYGHTGLVSGQPIISGMSITEDHATALLQADLAYFEEGVNYLCAHSYTSNQFSALVSFAFNVGLSALRTSTLMYYANKQMYALAAKQFGLWIYDGSDVLPGLVTRRAAEAKLFLTA